MSLFVSDERLAKRFVPGPVLERGHAYSLYAHPKEAKVSYGFNKFVIVRSLTDSTDNFVYRGHKYNVNVARFSPNGFWVASGDEGGFVRVWSWDHPEHITKLEVQLLAGPIKDLAWDPESKKLAVVGDGKGVVAKCIMWDTGNTVGEMVGHSKKCLTVTYRPARPFRIATGSEDFKVVFYKGPPFKMDHSEKSHSNYVNCVRYSEDGTRFASVGSDKKIVLYEGAEGTVEKELKAAGKAHPQGSVYSCAFSAGGSKLATADANKCVTVWAVSDGTVEATLSLGANVGDMQMGLLWAHGTLVSLSLSGDLNYLDAAASGLTKRKVVCAPMAPISTMTVVGAAVVVGCNDGTVFTSTATDLNKAKGAVPKSIVNQAHLGKVTAAVALDDAAFATAGFDDKVRFADIAADGTATYVAEVPTEVVASTSKGVCVVGKGGVEKFEAASWDPTAVAAFGSTFVVVGAKDGSLHVMDASLTETKTLASHRGEITVLRFSPDGSMLAVGDADREIKLYAVADWSVALENVWRHHTARVTGLAWHPEGTHLASTSNDEAIFKWTVAKPSEKPAKVEFSHKEGTTGLAYQGTHLVSAGNDGCTCFWNI